MATRSTSLPLLRTWTQFHTRTITCISFNTDGEFLATASHDGLVIVFAVNTGVPCTGLHLDPFHFGTAIHWISDSQFWLASSDGSVTLWSLNNRIEPCLQMIDALPFFFPHRPHLLASAGTRVTDKTLVVGFGGTFEQWGQDGWARGSWSGRGRAASIATEDIALAAWPLSSTVWLIVFKESGARLWRCADDSLDVIIGWPTGVVNAAHLLRPPRDLALSTSTQLFSAPKQFFSTSTQLFSANSDADCAGRVVVLVQDTVQILALNCNMRHASFARVLHQVACTSFAQPTMSQISSWNGIPILVTPTSSGLGAIDLSLPALHHAATSSDTEVDSLMSQLQQPGEWSNQRVIAIAGGAGYHVAAAQLMDDCFSISIWSVTALKGTVHAVVSPRNFAPPRLSHMHEQLQRHILKVQATRKRKRLIVVAGAFTAALALVSTAGWLSGNLIWEAHIGFSHLSWQESAIAAIEQWYSDPVHAASVIPPQLNKADASEQPVMLETETPLLLTVQYVVPERQITAVDKMQVKTVSLQASNQLVGSTPVETSNAIPF